MAPLLGANLSVTGPAGGHARSLAGLPGPGKAPGAGRFAASGNLETLPGGARRSTVRAGEYKVTPGAEGGRVRGPARVACVAAPMTPLAVECQARDAAAAGEAARAIIRRTAAFTGRIGIRDIKVARVAPAGSQSGSGPPGSLPRVANRQPRSA